MPDAKNTREDRCGRERDEPFAARGRPGGFSLIEVLVAVTLLVVMYVIMLSPSSRSNQMRKMAACANNLRSIQVALKTYALDANGRLPLSPGAETSEVPLSSLIPKYTTGTEFFICPGSGDSALPQGRPFAGRSISYAYYMGHETSDGPDQPLLTDRQVNGLPKQDGDALFSPDGYKPGANHSRYGGNVMLLDGSITTSPPKAAFPLTNGPKVKLLNPKP